MQTVKQTLVSSLTTTNEEAMLIADKIINHEIASEKALVYVGEESLTWSSPYGGVVEGIASSQSISTYGEAKERAEQIKDALQELVIAVLNRVEDIEKVSASTQELINQHAEEALKTMQEGKGTEDMMECTKAQTAFDSAMQKLAQGKLSTPLNESPLLEGLQIALQEHPDAIGGTMDFEQCVRCVHSALSILENILEACNKAMEEDADKDA